MTILIFKNSVPKLSEDEENTLEKNLVWIIANPRSGTTWLGTKLLSYNTISINETLIGLHLGSLVPDMKNKLVRMLDFFKDEDDYFFNKKFKDTWKYYLRKLILHRIYAQTKDLTKKIIIKEPSASEAPEILLECLPNCKAIILFRDGRDFLDSRLDAQKENSWMEKQGYPTISSDERLAFIEKKATVWVLRINSLLKIPHLHGKDLCLMIKYEDLLENTFDNLKKIYEFLNINIDDKKLNEIVDKASFSNIPSDQKGSGHVTRSATPGKWKENFNEKEKELVHKIMGNTLDKLGYK